MATYQDYDYQSSGFKNRSPRGNSDRQNLGFLDDFDASASNEQVDSKYVQEKLLYRRGITYTVILSITLIIYTRYWNSNVIVSTVSLVICFIKDVRSALVAVWWPAPTPNATNLERRSSSVPTNLASSSRASVSQHRRPRNVAGAAASTSLDDPYRDMHPDYRPRRLWNESLHNAWPHVRNDLIAVLHRIPYIMRDMWMAHLVFQILITLMQTLGVHFREGHDNVGIFPRCVANIQSTQNLFGVGGLAGVGRGYVSLARWWWNLIVVCAGKVWGFLIHANSLPDKFLSEDDLVASGTTSIHRQANMTSTGVRQ